jgi:hypothetical protein
MAEMAILALLQFRYTACRAGMGAGAVYGLRGTDERLFLGGLRDPHGWARPSEVYWLQHRYGVNQRSRVIFDQRLHGGQRLLYGRQWSAT